MTESPLPDNLEQRLQQAVVAALDTLVALASDRSDPGQARLAAAEILRFATRRRPEEPQPRRHEPVRRARAVTSGLGTMLDLLTGTLAPMTPDLPVDVRREAASEARLSATEPPPHASSEEDQAPLPDPLLRRDDVPPRPNLSDIAGAPRGKK